MSIESRAHEMMSRLNQLMSDHPPQNAGQQYADIQAMIVILAAHYAGYHRLGKDRIDEVALVARNALERYRETGAVE